MNAFYRVFRFVTGLLIRTLARVEIEGRENVPERGPLIVAVNHLHWLDIPLALMALPILPGPATAFAAEKWHHRFPGGHILAALGATFVRRGAPDRRALQRAMEILKAGGIFGIAPEGTRSRVGELQPARAGIAYIASRTGAPILPMAAYGQEKVFSSLRRGRRATVRVVIGKPFTLPGTPNRARGELLEGYTDTIMRRLAELLPPEYRGAYGDDAPRERSALQRVQR